MTEVIGLTIWVIFLTTIPPWICFKMWGDSNQLGLFMVLCRKLKYTKWLTWDIWGKSDWYLDILEQRIKEWKALKRQ